MSNDQTRAASISHAPAPAGEPLRSASFGSLQFFKKSDPAPFFAADEPPLDIVDALGTLNIDDVPESSSQLGLEDTSVSSDLANVSANSKMPGSVLEPHESLTPHPPQMGAFRVAESDATPLSKWGNTFVPFSAPPFAYPVADPLLTSQMAMLIAPFALPDETLLLNAGTPGLNGSHAVSPSPQPGPQFGGILNLRIPFDAYAQTPEFSEYNRFGPKNASPVGSDSSADKSVDKSATPGGQEFSNMSFYPHLDSLLDVFSSPPILSGMNLWNQKQLYPMQHGNPQLANSHYGNSGAQQMESRGAMQGSFHGYNRGNMAVGNNAGHAHHSNSGENDSGVGGPGGYPYNRRQNDHFNGMNSRVNIHRKMHNSNRKKGDMATKYANATLDDFTGDIYSLCKDQHGCRFLQRQLDLSKEQSSEKSTSSDSTNTGDRAATMIFNEIHPKIVELMVDPFGNYLVQKLFENVTPSQRLILVRNAAPEFIRIALDPHGTRALQKLMEQISSPEEARYIIDSLSPHVVALSRDLNGNHVVQKCLQRLSPEDNQFVFDAAAQHCVEIATHRHGCCVLQRCLDHGNNKQREQLSLRVAEIATTLSLDPYGNYVVQYVLSRGDEKSIAIILDHIRANIISLSLHKFGSNVIEKTLRTRKLSEEVIEVLLKNSSHLLVLLNDPYGNYVLQTGLDVASPTNLPKLAQSLQPLLPNIKNTPHGRRIFTKIQHIL